MFPRRSQQPEDIKRRWNKTAKNAVREIKVKAEISEKHVEYVWEGIFPLIS